MAKVMHEEGGFTNKLVLCSDFFVFFLGGYSTSPMLAGFEGDISPMLMHMHQHRVSHIIALRAILSGKEALC